MFTRETIYNIAHKHGLKATFSPRLHTDSCESVLLSPSFKKAEQLTISALSIPGSPRPLLRDGAGGSGAHTHISVHGGRTPPSRTADAHRAPTLTPAERSFLSGLLAHLPALCALTLPTAASYARMLDGIWAGGTYASWGTYNREAPVRVCGPEGHRHFEVKCVDATATPHLAIAGLLAAGATGVADGLLLELGDAQKPVAEMDERERREVGLEEGKVRRLPQTIADARRLLGGDEVLRGVLGDEFVEKYLGVNEVSRTVQRLAAASTRSLH